MKSYKKGDVLLYRCSSFSDVTLKLIFLGYNSLDPDYFIAEDECGDVSDDWMVKEIVEVC